MKENKQPLLSICIPTWNRWYSLQYTLQSIMDQDEFKSGDVEIVISDNASNDETEVEVKKLCNKHDNIRYFRNKKNIGGNPNINKVLSLGKGKYLWLLGSDTLVSAGGIAKIISIIKYKKVDIIYNLVEGLNNFNHIGDNYSKETDTYYFNNTIDFFNHLGNQYIYDKRSWKMANIIMTFASSICISKKFFEKSIEKINNVYYKTNFDNNYFSQELICFSICANNGIIIINHEYLYRYQFRKTGYYHKYQIVKDMKSLMNYIIDNYNIKNRNFIMLSNRIIFHRYGNYFNSLLIKILTKLKLYKFLSRLWRKYVLKNRNEAKGLYMENAE